MLKKNLMRALLMVVPLLLVAFMVSKAMADGKYQSNLSPVATTYDAGNDEDSDGTNDGRPMPACKGAPHDPTSLLCINGDSAGVACEVDSDCVGSGTCVNRSAPDGITAGDSPRTTPVCITKKSKVQIKDTALKAKITLDDASITTVVSGVCDGGDNDGSTCKKATDCRDAAVNKVKTNHDCVSGDEYFLQCDFIVGSNLDDAPACGAANQSGATCLLGFTSTGTTGGVDPVPGALGGAAGLCSGGVRDGDICQGDANCQGLCDDNTTLCSTDADCLGDGGTETCDGLAPGTCPCLQGNPLDAAATGDELCFAADVTLLGKVFMCPLCPIQAQIDSRFEVKKGKGKVKTKLDEGPLKAFVPDGVPLNVIGCYVHEPGPTDKLSVLGFFVDKAAQVSNTKVPCADISMPLSAQAGINVDAPVSPIICATGGIGEKGGGKFFKP